MLNARAARGARGSAEGVWQYTVRFSCWWPRSQSSQTHTSLALCAMRFHPAIQEFPAPVTETTQPTQEPSSWYCPRQVKSEKEALEACDHPNIVRLHAAFTEEIASSTKAWLAEVLPGWEQMDVVPFRQVLGLHPWP